MKAVVVADTSPLHYLVLVGHVRLLPELFGEVRVPAEVLGELAASAAPEAVRAFAAAPPAWIVRVESAAMTGLSAKLGAGEQAAISLCMRELDSLRSSANAGASPEVLLLIDDSRGRMCAQALGIPVIGTLGILRFAAERGLANFEEAIARLRTTNMRLPQNLGR